MTSGLAGRRITKVRYRGLSTFGAPPPEWDFGVWHHPLMDVELAFAGGGRLVAGWGDAYGNFGVDLRAVPPGGAETHDASREWDVTGHPRWARLTAEPVVRARVIWQDDLWQGTSDDRADLPGRPRVDCRGPAGELAAGWLVPPRFG